MLAAGGRCGEKSVCLLALLAPDCMATDNLLCGRTHTHTKVVCEERFFRLDGGAKASDR